jgi:hypothetical protein
MAKMKYRDWLANEIEVLLCVSLTEILDPLAEQYPIDIEELRDHRHAAIELAMSRITAVMDRYKIGFNHNWLVEVYGGDEE